MPYARTCYRGEGYSRKEKASFPDDEAAANEKCRDGLTLYCRFSVRPQAHTGIAPSSTRSVAQRRTSWAPQRVSVRIGVSAGRWRSARAPVLLESADHPASSEHHRHQCASTSLQSRDIHGVQVRSVHGGRLLFFVSAECQGRRYKVEIIVFLTGPSKCFSHSPSRTFFQGAHGYET